MNEQERIMATELYAWLGEDEFGSGKIGFKTARVPAGMISLVAINRDRIDRDDLSMQLAQESAQYGKAIYLVRFRVDEIVRVIAPESQNRH